MLSPPPQRGSHEPVVSPPPSHSFDPALTHDVTAYLPFVTGFRPERTCTVVVPDPVMVVAPVPYWMMSIRTPVENKPAGMTTWFVAVFIRMTLFASPATAV